MDFQDSPQDAQFRAECSQWLAAHARLKTRSDEIFGPDLAPAERLQAARQLQAQKAAAGYGAITWPLSLIHISEPTRPY